VASRSLFSNTPLFGRICMSLARLGRLCLLSAVMVLAAPENGRAGFIDDLVDSAGDAMESVGGFFGRGVGGFLDSASAPAIQNLENAGHRLIQDADHRMSERIRQMEGAAGKTIADLDTRLENRILQIDGMAARRLDQLDRIAQGNIKVIDENLKKRIEQVDEVLGRRIDQVDGVIANSIERVDQVLAEKIQKIDELSEQRIGNLDLIATKASLSVESSLARFVGIACLVVFAACAVWRLYSVGFRNWIVSQNVAEWFRLSAWPLAWQVGGAAICMLLLWGVIWLIPSQPAKELAQLQKEHEAGLSSSFVSLDYRRASYHASQLRLIVPGESKYRGADLKALVMRDLFMRPALRSTTAGVFDLANRIEQAQVLLGEADLDLEVAKAFLQWQVGSSRRDEYLAAVRCANALEMHAATADAGQVDWQSFPLADLALCYLNNYLAMPMPLSVVGADGQPTKGRDATPTQSAATMDNKRLSEISRKAMAAGLNPARPKVSLTSLGHVLEYDRLVRLHYPRISHHYGQMVRAHAMWIASEKKNQEAVNARMVQAQEVIKCWNELDVAISTNGRLNGTTAPLALFSLNDVYYVRARWFVRLSLNASSPPTGEAAQAVAFDELLAANLPEIAPTLAEAATFDTLKGENNQWKRAWFAPPRTLWSARYLSKQSVNTQDVLQVHLRDEFLKQERDVVAFEKKVLT
jgi:hypothetical protein